MSAQVEFRGITKKFGSTLVLDNISFKVQDGEFLVLLGPSGCGKSTLLRLVAGLEQLTSGEISVAGRLINDIHPSERNLAMVFQNYALYPLMTVRQNMAFSQKIRKVPPKQVEKRVNEVAEILRIGELLDRKPAELSGGQRQRVAMGRAMMRSPEVFLFDEPLSNLDARLRARMRSEVKLLHRKIAATTIYVTHDQVEAMTMADRIVVMRNGTIAQIGTPHEIFNHPCNIDVARFVGSPEINCLPGQIVVEGTEARCNVAGAMLALPSSMNLPAGEVMIGIRPSNLEVAPADEPGAICGMVQTVEPTGGFDFIHLLTEGGAEVIIQAAEGTTAEPGKECGFRFEISKAHMFTTNGEKRLS